MARVSRFKLRDSERSGFTFKESQLRRDGGVLVGPDEYDQPPPSRQSLGGEGEVSGDPRNRDGYVLGATTAQATTVYYITAAGGISATFRDPNATSSEDRITLPWMQIAGSNGAINITADPQITAGRDRQALTLECVGSNITLEDGTGLALMGDRPFTMTSGSIITFLYDTGGTGVWSETSRTP